MNMNSGPLSAEELDAESAGALPERQAMTTLGDLDTSSLLPDSLLDLDVNLDLDADVAVPIDAAIAANANVAAPIDAAVSANVLSPGAVSIASASLLTRKWPQPDLPVCIFAPPISSRVTSSPITIWAIRGEPRYIEALPSRMITTSQKAGM